MEDSRKSLLIVYGGRSGEHDVSVASAASVAKAVDRKVFRPLCVRIGRDGRWRLEGESVADGRGPERVLLPVPGVGRLLTRGGRPAERIDAVFPLVHGTTGEDGCLQGLLELAELPYVGCGVLGSAVGMDKDVMKRLLLQAGLPTAPYEAVRQADGPTVARVARRIGFPCFVKPANSGSSVGIGLAKDKNGLDRALREALRYDLKAIVERAVPQPREIECSVMGNGTPLVSEFGEIVPGNEFYDYEAKYGEAGTRLVVPVRLPVALKRRLTRLAALTWRALEAEGLGRVDFLVDGHDGTPYVNEINTLPGFTEHSMYPKLWEASGVGYGQLITRLVRLATERHAVKSRLCRDRESVKLK